MIVSVTLAVTGVLGLLGVVAHEMTHYAVWRACGRRPAVMVWPPTIYIPEGDYERVETRDRVAAGAPFGIGVISLVLALAVGVEVSLPLLGAWVGYSAPFRDLGLIFADSNPASS